MEDINEIEVMDTYGFVYITTNLINGKKYIGQRMFRKRWKNYLGSGTIFKRAINKYGKENFSREIIAIAYSKDELNLMEIEFINNHDAIDSLDYYNLSFGGDAFNSGLHFSDEHKKKMSLAQMGNKNCLGNKHTEESKKKMSESALKMSDEHKENLSLAQKGKHLSKEIKLKISETQRRLSNQQALEIREKYTTNQFKQIDLAKEYLVSQVTISRIINFQGYSEKSA